MLITYPSLLSARCKLSVKSQTIKCLTIQANIVVLIGSKFPTYLFSPEGVVVGFNIDRCTSLAYSRYGKKRGLVAIFYAGQSLVDVDWHLRGFFQVIDCVERFKWLYSG